MGVKISLTDKIVTLDFTLPLGKVCHTHTTIPGYKQVAAMTSWGRKGKFLPKKAKYDRYKLVTRHGNFTCVQICHPELLRDAPLLNIGTAYVTGMYI